MSIGIFTLPLAANEVREADITGEYFELRNALQPVVLIELLDRTGGVIARLDNPEQSDFVRPGRYEKIRITNGAVAQTVKHFYGTGDAGSRRTSGLVKVEGLVNVAGDVSVIDGEKTRTLAGGMFGGAPAVAGVAAQYSAVQLWNPAASGKNLIVTQLDIGSDVASNAVVFFKALELPTAYGFAISNKLSGAGAAPVAALKTENSAAAEAYALGILRNLSLAANNPILWPIRGALVVRPGYGLNVRQGTLAARVSADFEWFEEPI